MPDAKTFDREHLRTFIVHSATDDLAVVRRLVNAKVLKLMVEAVAKGMKLPSPPAFKPQGPESAFPLNVRNLYDWIEAVELPNENDRSPDQHQAQLHAENVELLLAAAATLKQRWGEE